jgi:hypothetical protein
VPIMDLERCKNGYKDGNENATITNATFCAGLLDKDACGVSTKIQCTYIYVFWLC